MKEKMKIELLGAVKWVVPILLAIVIYKFFDNVSFIFGWLCGLLKILTPFVVGFVIAYFLNKPVSKLDFIIKRTVLKKHSRLIGVIIVYAVFILLIYLLLRVLIPTFADGLTDFITVLPQYGRNLLELINRIDYLKELQLTERVSGMIEQFIASIQIADISLYLQRIINIGAIVLNIFLSIVISVYMVLEKDSLISVVRRTASLFLSGKKIESIAGYLHESDHVIYHYFVGQLCDCFIVAAGSCIGLWILGAPYPLVLGFFFGMFNIIPYFGPIISGVFVVLVIFVSDLQNNFMLAVWCAIFLLVFQQIDANIINPKILGNALDMSPFWVIFAVTVFSGLFGFTGMIIGVPCMGIIRMLYRDVIAFKRRKGAGRAEDL